MGLVLATHPPSIHPPRPPRWIAPSAGAAAGRARVGRRAPLRPCSVAPRARPRVSLRSHLRIHQLVLSVQSPSPARERPSGSPAVTPLCRVLRAEMALAQPTCAMLMCTVESVEGAAAWGERCRRRVGRAPENLRPCLHPCADSRPGPSWPSRPLFYSYRCCVSRAVPCVSGFSSPSSFGHVRSPPTTAARPARLA
jgi:hypothetical protein